MKSNPMKPTQFLYYLLSFGSLSLLAMPSGVAQEPPPISPAPVLHIKDLNSPATTVKDWFAQIEATITQITNVTLNRTDTGLEIILDTQDGKALQVDASQFTTQGNALIAEIPNAVLTLPDDQPFQVANPVADISQISVEQSTANSVRITVLGDQASPTTDVTLKVGEFAYSLNPEANEPDEEIVVTGEGQRNYQVPNASSATRTDTPIRDTPASIQVIPQQVIRDQQVVRIDEALNNVSAVGYKGAIDSRGYNFTIRGFDNAPVLRDGYRVYGTIQGFAETANLDRIEVLKGPASILYGDVQPGGVINLVSKQPLSTPFYEVELQAGNRDFLRPRIDFTGPATRDGKILYRINALYQQNDSWRNYDTPFQRVSFAPSLTWKISDRTSFNTFLEYLDDAGYADFGQVIIGDTLAKVPPRRIPNSPDDSVTNKYLRVGYNLEHNLSDDWKIRNTFSYQNYQYDYSVLLLPFAFIPRTNLLGRVIGDQDGTYKVYSLQTNVVGKFETGSIQHTLLAGVDLSRSEVNVISRGIFGPRGLIPFDIFAPNYNIIKPRESSLPLFSDNLVEGDRFGLYLQDQISLFDNKLILLAGLRYDTIEQTNTTVAPASTTEINQTDDAVTPRIGLVYHPIPELSLYGSYARSFNPNSATNILGEALDPEEGEGFEAGIKAELLDQKLAVTLAYFDLKKQNVAVADPQFLGFSIATGEQRSRGVELDLAGEIMPGWNIIASYAYIDAEITKDSVPINIGSRLGNIPKHSSSLWTTYEIQSGNLKGLGFGIGFNLVGERFGGLPTSYRADSYFLTNAAIFYRTGKWRLAINAKNLFDIEYVQSLSQNSRVRTNYPGDPFTIIGSVSVEF